MCNEELSSLHVSVLTPCLLSCQSSCFWNWIEVVGRLSVAIWRASMLWSTWPIQRWCISCLNLAPWYGTDVAWLNWPPAVSFVASTTQLKSLSVVDLLFSLEHLFTEKTDGSDGNVFIKFFLRVYLSFFCDYIPFARIPWTTLCRVILVRWSLDL